MRIGNNQISLELDETSALDIGALAVDGVEMSPGDAVPDDGDGRILHAVRGFLFTCGPDHIRHPEPIGERRPGARYPLHGSMSGHRPEILSRTSTAEGERLEARIAVAMAQGGVAEISRRLSFDNATGEVEIEDVVLNAGPDPFAPLLMYHMNIGAHLFDNDTRLSGQTFANGAIDWRFGEGEGHVFCTPAVSQDGWTHVQLGPIAAIGGRSLHVRFSTDTLGHLQMWRNQAGHCDVLGIEPVSHPWMPRADLAAAGLMEPIQPGQSRSYRIAFRFR